MNHFLIENRNKATKYKLSVNFIHEITFVSPKIKFACLQEYEKKCRQLHNIAFFQWLVSYSKGHAKIGRLEDLIDIEIHDLYEKE